MKAVNDIFGDTLLLGYQVLSDFYLPQLRIPTFFSLLHLLKFHVVVNLLIQLNVLWLLVQSL